MYKYTDAGIMFKEEKNMKNMKKFAALTLCAAMTTAMLGGVTVFANDSGIDGVDDLPGKKIGVQLGTTGDLYASDYEGDEELSLIHISTYSYSSKCKQK